MTSFLGELSKATCDLSLFGHKRLARELWYVIGYHERGPDGACLICAEQYPCATLKHLSLGLNVNWSTFDFASNEGIEVD